MAEIPGETVVMADVPAQTVQIVPSGLDSPEQSTAPQTTAEQNRATESQRTVNLIWETTQMRVALSVIWTSLIVAAVLSVMGRWLGTPDVQLAAIVFLFGVANLVTGFYFGRTNHNRQGGIGGESKAESR